jgi:hypothetical protein
MILDTKLNGLERRLRKVVIIVEVLARAEEGKKVNIFIAFLYRSYV